LTISKDFWLGAGIQSSKRSPPFCAFFH